MTHADYLREASLDVARELPGFAALDGRTREGLIELGEHYFDEEFTPRLLGIVNVPRYQEAMHEKTPEDREYLAEQAEFLQESIAKAQAAAREQLLEKYNSMIRGRRG